MDRLLFKLHKKCIEIRNAACNTNEKSFVSVLMAKDMMARDQFMYSDIGCEFHRKEDVNLHCCLSKVKRWGYMISKFCLDDQLDEKLPGRHFPEDISAENDDDVQSSIIKDSDWESDISESFKHIRIASNTTMSHESSARSMSSSQEVTPSVSGASIGGTDKNAASVPSCLAASTSYASIVSSSSKNILNTKASLSQILTSRGVKPGQTRGGKRQN